MRTIFPRIIPGYFPYQIEKGPKANIINKFGTWNALYFQDNRWGTHIALMKGSIESFQGRPKVFLRIDSGCYTGAVLGDMQCDCVQQLHRAMKIIDHHGHGLIVLVPGHEARGYGLEAKIRSFRIQQQRHVGTVTAFKVLGFNPPDIRSYEGVAYILKRLKLSSINLLSNNPHKASELKRYGVVINKVVPLIIRPTKLTRIHLKEKQEKLGHRGLITKIH